MTEKTVFGLVSVLLCITIGMIVFLKKDEVVVSKEEKTSSFQAKNNEQVDTQNNIKITFLDIGQGDASFIEWSNGEQMLIDCAKDSLVLAALGRTMKYFDSSVDYLVVTHPDLDHFGGCSDVLKRFEVKNIIYTGLQKNDKSWQYFWQQVQNENANYIEIKQEQTMRIASSTLHFLYPSHNLSEDAKIPDLNKNVGDNNASLVFQLSYGTQDVLFTGDMEEPLEKYLVQTYGQKLDSEVLKVGHHGSGSSSSQEFLNIVTPDISTISVGKDNTYGHPSMRVLKRLERVNSDVFRTDLRGDIVLKIWENKIETGN